MAEISDIRRVRARGDSCIVRVRNQALEQRVDERSGPGPPE